MQTEGQGIVEWLGKHLGIQWILAGLSAVGAFYWRWWTLERKLGQLRRDVDKLARDRDKTMGELAKQENRFLTISGELRLMSERQEARDDAARENLERMYQAIDNLTQRFEEHAREQRQMVLEAIRTANHNHKRGDE